MLYIQGHVTALDLFMFNDMAYGAMCQDCFTLPHVTWQAAMLVRCMYIEHGRSCVPFKRSSVKITY